jgi:predicted adenine nucleotide alpha hydrolase (AANH) superfamily ATPase
MEISGNQPHVRLEVPLGAKRVLLHACCAPCSSAVVECLVDNGIESVIFYSNSNIFPREEYDHRLNECVRYAREWGIPIVDDVYDHEDWGGCAKGLEDEPERGGRCLQCFKYRLLRAARYAAENGFPVLTTTLASSRWKSLEQITQAGLAAQEAVEGTLFWAQNWRKGGLQDRRNELLHEYNFYNQQYCGCEFSMR